MLQKLSKGLCKNIPSCHSVDVDECDDNMLNECDENAKCTNNVGSYDCHCYRGFTGDGYSCSMSTL